jgi:hypothetical protein
MFDHRGGLCPYTNAIQSESLLDCDDTRTGTDYYYYNNDTTDAKCDVQQQSSFSRGEGDDDVLLKLLQRNRKDMCRIITDIRETILDC